MLNHKGQMAATEFIVILMLLLALGGSLWYIFARKTDMTINQYGKGSKPSVTDFVQHCSPFSCCNDAVEKERYERTIHSQNNRSN